MAPNQEEEAAHMAGVVPAVPDPSKFLDADTSTTSRASGGKSVQFHQDSMPPDDTGGDAKSTKSTLSNNHSTVSGSGKRGAMTHQKSTMHIKTHENFKQKMESERKELGVYVILPWNSPYKFWFGFTVVWAAFTLFFETYAIGFLPGGGNPRDDPASSLQYFLIAVFVGDILVNFNLAYTDEGGQVVFGHKKIARHYFNTMFWVDFVGIFPFYTVALSARGEMLVDNQQTRYLQLLRLFTLVRVHRLFSALKQVEYSSHVSLLWLTLIRNFGAALLWSHFAACVMYFIARQSGFQDSWLEEPPSSDTLFDSYVTSLYWSVVTFATVGYGDFSPVNAAEQIFGIVYMFVNMLMTSWIIGSITLLVVKNDEKNGEYRENLQLLDDYASMHNFDRDFRKRLKNQLKLDFNTREVSDENVLKNFPSSLRRRVLRELYLSTLQQTHLMQGLRQLFVDTFLSSCWIEIHGPGEELVQRGSISNDLYLLLDGTIKVTTSTSVVSESEDNKNKPIAGGSMMDSEYADGGGQAMWAEKESGDFINDIGFFTDSPSITTIRTVTICKTLTISKAVYKSVAIDHPNSAIMILQNLLVKAKVLASKGDLNVVELPKPLPSLRAGSYFDLAADDKSEEDQTMVSAFDQAAVTTVEDLITMHINKQKDDHTTRFLFAASRGDIPTMRVMLSQTFDPNGADYDRRTALMVASMNGNSDAVSLLLENHCNPNLVDVHGTSALFEAVKGSHDDCIKILMENDGKLCMSEEIAATKLCQCVFDGDIKLLTRLCKAGINLNAGDYDARTALHIAACEGNVTAVRVLVEYGANLSVKDRWNNSVFDEAKRSNSIKVMEYFKSLE